MIGRCLGWLQRWDPRAPRPTSLGAPASPAVVPSAASVHTPLPAPVPMVRGSAEGWLRVLPASDLFQLMHARRALDAMFRQSRLSQGVWERDLLPALHRYAEFVQLMPASESHHHAHVGGLLSHTLEMTLAAMTWRNGHFFPEGASVEAMDAQRDEWTYVVFFAALLHDVGKVMTDLRVSWQTADMDACVRWVPMSGPLTAMVQSRSGGEYLVAFTPKSARDYAAHARLAAILLQQVAPPSALSFMARRPPAFEALTQYLGGADRHSLLAQLVRKADQSSTQQALAHGSRERFATSSSVALIDLLMQAMREMLKAGTVLPLNRSGAAGWVHQGSLWMVAKRLADAVRQHIRQHHPEESVPGDNKNDRLFDTWQEYGCITTNPQTGQAIWYVQVQGHGGVSESAEPAQEEAGLQDSGLEDSGVKEGAYSHTLTVLRFPLEKVFEDPQQYPAAMRGRIEVLARRSASGTTAEQSPQNPVSPDEEDVAVAQASTGPAVHPKAEAAHTDTAAASEVTHQSRTKPDKTGANSLRAPVFKKPVPKPSDPAAPKRDPTSKPLARSEGRAQPERLHEAAAVHPDQPPAPAAKTADHVPARDKWLDFEDDAAMFREMPKLPGSVSHPAPAPSTGSAPKAIDRASAVRAKEQPKAAPASASRKSAAPSSEPQKTAAAPDMPVLPSMPALPSLPVVRPLLARDLPPELAAATSLPRLQTEPVLLSPFLPELPHETASQASEPSASALAFMQWLQQGLAQRSLKYNETGALVHFTAEGMALVSPLVFKTYVADQDPCSDALANAQALQVQREVIKAGWHLMGPGKSNILRYEVMGRGGVAVGKLSAVVLTRADRWVVPVPPINPVLRLT